MLKQLRNKKRAKKIWITLAILVLPAFILWGSGSVMRNKETSSYAGKIFGKKISWLEYRDAFEATRNQALIQFGDNFDKIQKSLNLESQTWERLILLNEAKKYKLRVTDKEVTDLIKSYPFFQRKGQFDNSTYLQLLQYVFHAQPRIFEEQTRKNLILVKLYRKVTDGITINEKEIENEYEKYNEQISISYITAIPSDFIKEISVLDQDIKNYFLKNSLEFKQPLSFNLNYITVDSENKAQLVFMRLSKKEELEKLTKELGVASEETGLFKQTDSIPGIGWAPQIMTLISKLKVGETSLPIQMDKNYYILTLKERKEPYIPDFDTIKDQVKEAFIKNKSKELAKEKINICLKKITEESKTNFKPFDSEKIASEYQLKSGVTDAFKYGSYIENIGASDIFWTTAKNLKEGEFSDVIEMPSGFYIIKLKSLIPIDKQKFASEKDNFSQELLLQKKQEYFAKFLGELKRKAELF